MDDIRRDGQQPSSEINCLDEIGKSVAIYFNNPEMSDVTLKLGSKTYHAHKFVLGLMSDVFRTMCSQRWEINGVGVEIELRECEECVPVFDHFLKFMYCGTATVDINSALPLLMLADKYNVQPLKQRFEHYMNMKVGEGSVVGALRWLSYAQLSGHSALQNACIEVVITKMDEVVKSDEFLHLELGFLLALLARDDLVVLWEQTIYEGVTRWIDAQHNVSGDELQTLLSYVRFPMMLPTQLHDAENSALYSAHNRILAPMFAAAHRFRSIALEVKSDAFAEPNFSPRNYTHRLWCHFLTVDVDGESFSPKSVGVRCVNHPVLSAGSTPDQLWQIQVAGERRTSRGTLSAGHKPSLPNLGYNFNVSHASADRTIPLLMTVTPTKPVARDMVVDVTLFQVKKDKIVKRLCQSMIKWTSEEEMEIERNETMSSLLQPQQQQQTKGNGTLKFSPSPMHFAFIFQPSTPSIKKNEAVLRYNFSLNELDHPAEVPCFKFSGPTRMTNSVRVAVVFKPRFILPNVEDLEEGTSASAKSSAFREGDSGFNNSSSQSDDSDSNILG